MTKDENLELARFVDRRVAGLKFKLNNRMKDGAIPSQVGDVVDRMAAAIIVANYLRQQGSE